MSRHRCAPHVGGGDPLLPEGTKELGQMIPTNVGVILQSISHITLLFPTFCGGSPEPSLIQQCYQSSPCLMGVPLANPSFVLKKINLPHVLWAWSGFV